jgi:hypothetical protein
MRIIRLRLHWSATLLGMLAGASLLLHTGPALPDEPGARYTNRLIDSNNLSMANYYSAKRDHKVQSCKGSHGW